MKKAPASFGHLGEIPRYWLSTVVLSGLLAACGGGSSADGAETKVASATGSASTEALPSVNTATFARNAALSSAELEAAEQQAQAAEASPSTILLDQLPAGEIAAKSAYVSGAVASKAAAVRISVYRFFNSSTGAHFFTTSTTERDNVVNTLSPPFSLEGTAFSVASTFSPGLSPVHRFYNTQSGVHFYTISETERANVAANFPQFGYEGVAYHASQVAGAGLIPFYRFYVPSKGFHFYTANEAEKNSIIANLAATYSYEGIGYYVLDSDWRAEKLPHTGITSGQCLQAGNNTLVACSSSSATTLNQQQDGNRASINAMSYYSVSNYPIASCVEDRVTGLIWEGKEASGTRAGGNTYTHLGNGLPSDTSGYLAAVNATNLCGFSDWRLPTRQELLNLVDYGRAMAPAITGSWFGNTASTRYWSVELNSINNANAWYVNFQNGETFSEPRSNANAVRLVRGNFTSGSRYGYSTVAYGSDGANNVVNDAWTGLQWRRCEQGKVWSGSACTGTVNTFTHEQALVHAQVHSDWRMPNIKELTSLVDLSVSSGARIDHAAFPGAVTGETWSSSPEVRFGGGAWALSSGGGYVGSSGRGNGHVVRLVRIGR